MSDAKPTHYRILASYIKTQARKVVRGDVLEAADYLGFVGPDAAAVHLERGLVEPHDPSTAAAIAPE